MPDVNLVAVAVAAVAAFVLSGLWYSVQGQRLAALHPAYAAPAHPIPLTAVVEIARNLVVASVTAGLAIGLGRSGPLEGVGLGLLLWLTFPVMILLGSVYHEKVPVRLAAIHAGDWLIKLVVFAVVGAWWR